MNGARRSPFDELIDRKDTHSLKWDRCRAVFGRDDIIPMWVADCDFRAPPAVVEALVRRAEHGVFGYAPHAESYLTAFCAWEKARHGWEISPEWVVFSPGVVLALHACVRAFTAPGQAVVIQPPVYPPFLQVPRSQGREPVFNQLVLSAGGYGIDFDDLEARLKLRDGLLILCSPHNPVGRVWTRAELERVAELVIKYDRIVVVDEIHGDMALSGSRHTPLASLSPEMAARTITCTAPSKTFNVPGLQISNIIIPDPGLRGKFVTAAERMGVELPNCFAALAAEAAYRHGAEWLDELLRYVEGNLALLRGFLGAELPQIGLHAPEATYLAWLDFRKVGLEDGALRAALVERAGVGLAGGRDFGPGGSGFQRMNLGCPRVRLEEALDRIKRVFGAPQTA